MSGSAPASGFEFQSAAFGFLAAHALADCPLNWFEGPPLNPSAIAMETGGPGDDLLVELSDGRRIEVQAKKGLSRGPDFYQAMKALFKGVRDGVDLLGVLLVDTKTSASIREEIRQDFIRLSDGRTESLKSETKELLATLSELGPVDYLLFQRLRIIVKDFGPGGDGCAAAISLLRNIVADSVNAEDSWKILCSEGIALCARRGRRDKEALAKLLHLTRVAERRLLTTENYLGWLKHTTAQFFVPILEIRRPIEEAWDQLCWLDQKSANHNTVRPTLVREVARYHEWARLAETFDRHVGPASDFLRAEPRLVIIGGPGSGKSTLLKQIAHNAAAMKQVVILVSLALVRNLIKRGHTFEEAIATAAAQGSSLDDAWMQMLLARADFLLADGLDETEPLRLIVADALANWSSAHPNTRVCITTRPVGHQSDLLHGFQEAELVPLRRDSIELLSRKLLIGVGQSRDEAEGLANRLSDRNRRHGNSSEAANLALRNPLLLTFLIRLLVDGKSIDGCRAELYRRIIELIAWAPIANRFIESDPGATATRAALEALAWKLQESPGIPRVDAMRFVTAKLSEMTTLPPIEVGGLVEAIERFWEERSMLERVRLGSQETITFLHLSLQEFAAAEHLAKMPDEVLQSWLTENRRHDTWHDVIILACGVGASDKILPQLFALDDPDDPNSAEAILAAAALLEIESPESQLVSATIQRLGHRLDCSIPLISIEAAQRLAGLGQLGSSLLLEVCLPRISHSQIWTRFGAFAALLSSRTQLLRPEQICDLLSDVTALEQTGQPEGAYELRKTTLARAFDELFKKMERNEARKYAGQFLDHYMLSVGEFEALSEVFIAYSNQDLLEQLPGCAERGRFSVPPDLIEQRWTAALGRLLLAATGENESPKINQVHSLLPNFIAILRALDFWEQPFFQILALSRNPQPTIAVPVLRAMIEALGVSQKDLGVEVNHLLALDDPDKAALDLHHLVRSTGSMDWSKLLETPSHEENLVPGLLHPSGLIRAAAAHLLRQGRGGIAVSVGLKEVLARANGDALHDIIFAGEKVWGAKTCFILMDRFKAGPQEGAEQICEAVAALADQNSLAQVEAFLLDALQLPFVRVVGTAAKALEELKLVPTSGYLGQLNFAFTKWKKSEFKCDRCDLLCVDGCCPNCRIVPYTPFSAMVRELTRGGILTLDELVELVDSEWLEMRDNSSKEIAKLVCSNSERFTQIVERLRLGCAPVIVLDAILDLPQQVLSELLTKLLPITESSDAKIRERFFVRLPSLSREGVTLKNLAQAALRDEDPAVRSAAAKALRALSKV